MNRLISWTGILLSSALVLAAAAPAQAETFPSRPIHLVLPYSPGGIIDFVGRTLAQKLGEVLGQTVVAENRPGAGGIVGVDSVVRATPDGYSIVLMDPAIVINPTMQKSMPDVEEGHSYLFSALTLESVAYRLVTSDAFLNIEFEEGNNPWSGTVVVRFAQHAVWRDMPIIDLVTQDRPAEDQTPPRRE